MSKRQYSDEERATALACLDANGGNVAATARERKIPRKTLEQWRDGVCGVVPAVAHIRQQKRGSLADQLEEIAWQAVAAWPAAIERANAAQLATVLGVAVDKMRLLRSEPTSIHEARTKDLTPDERIRRIAAVLAGEDPDADRAGPAGAAAGASGSPLGTDLPAVH